jgi:YD repeat-containing protein
MQNYEHKRYAFTYDSTGHVTQIDAGDKHVAYTYKGSGDSADLMSSRDVDGGVTQYAYDANHDLTSIVYPDKKTVRMTYPGDDGSVGTVTCPDGTKWSFSRAEGRDPVITIVVTPKDGIAKTTRLDAEHYENQTPCE